MIRALLLIVLGAASFAAVYTLMPPGPPGGTQNNETAEPPSVLAPEVETVATPPQQATGVAGLQLRPGAEAIDTARDSPRTIRDVAPNSMTAGPRVTGTLK